MAAKDPKEGKAKDAPAKEPKARPPPKEKGIKSLPEGDSKELKDLPD